MLQACQYAAQKLRLIIYCRTQNMHFISPVLHLLSLIHSWPVLPISQLVMDFGSAFLSKNEQKKYVHHLLWLGVSKQDGSIGTFLTYDLPTSNLGQHTKKSRYFPLSPTSQILIYVVNHLVLDWFIPDHFHFIHHTTIWCYILWRWWASWMQS